jgi:glycogen synthase
VLPARYEPFGLGALEAAMSGCALVLGDIETLRELWDGAAVFADPRDDDALLDATMRLIADHDLRRAMAAQALRRVQHYSAAAMVDGYMSAYRRVLFHRAATAVRPAAVAMATAEAFP